MTGSKSVLFEARDGVGCITLNRPDTLNVINPELLADLKAAVTACVDDPSVRAVLLAGAGPSFCGGGDLRLITEQQEATEPFVREMATDFHVIASRLARLDRPVVCAVQGAAAGGGLSLACLADVVLAAEGAKFRVAYPAIGFTLDGGLSWTLPRLVGLRRALDLAIVDRPFDSAYALQIGLISEIVPDLELTDRASALATRLAAGPTGAYGRIKALLRQSLDHSLETQLDFETRAISVAAASPDGQEGVGAFLGKRQAKFGGAPLP